MAHVVSVHAGRAAVIGERRGRPFRSAIDKQPVTGRAPVGPLGLEADEQVHRRYHGGPLQAVYAYAQEDEAFWTTETGTPFDATVLGQNLTTARVDLSTVEVGERWAVGTVVLRATRPRIPCRTLQQRSGVRGIVRRFTQAGRPGAYFAVEQGGAVGAGDAIEVLHRPGHGMTMARMLALMTVNQGDRAELLPLAEVDPELRAWAAGAPPAPPGRRGTPAP